MGITNLYTKHSVQLHPVGVDPAALVGGLTRLSIETGTEKLVETSDVEVYPDFVDIQMYRPNIQWTTLLLAAALDAFGVGPTCVVSDVSHPGLIAWLAKRGCSGPMSGSNHLSYTAAAGIVIPNQLQVSHRTPAQISYAMTTQGATPIVAATAQPLPTVVASTNVQRFDLHSVNIAGNAISQKLQIGINFAAQLYQEGADSEVFDSFVGLQELRPVITFTNRSQNSFGTFGFSGAACTHANSEIILKKRKVATSTAEHIKITFQGLATTGQIVDASGLQPSDETIMVDTVRDSANPPLVVDTAYAIS